jgi:hypothetical protein
MYVLYIYILIYMVYFKYILMQAAMDVLHAVDLGVWVHLLTAVAMRYKNILTAEKNMLTSTQVANVWDKLNRRVEELDSNVSLFRLNTYQSSIFKFLVFGRENPAEKKKNYRSWEHHLLMMVQYTEYILNIYHILNIYLNMY